MFFLYLLNEMKDENACWMAILFPKFAILADSRVYSQSRRSVPPMFFSIFKIEFYLHWTLFLYQMNQKRVPTEKFHDCKMTKKGLKH